MENVQVGTNGRGVYISSIPMAVLCPGAVLLLNESSQNTHLEDISSDNFFFPPYYRTKVDLN